MLVAYKLSKFTDAWEVNACFASMHITFIKFGDQSDYITKFTRFLEIGCVSFLRFYVLRDCFLQLYHWHCHKLFNSIPCSVFLAPDLSKHYPKLAIKLGPSCLLVGSQSEHNVLLLLTPKGSASDIISLVIGFIHYTYVYFLVIINWGSNEVSYTQIKSLLSIEKSLIDARGQLLSYLTLSVN